MAGGGRMKRKNSDEDATSSSSYNNSSKRTGQACRRCKERKIKCDTRHGKCGPCTAANEDCLVLDRNTGEQYRRGVLAEAEAELQAKNQLIFDLQQQLRAAGITPVEITTALPLDGAPGHHAALLAFDRTRMGSNYLGAVGHSNLSMLQGSQITIFGDQFDLDAYFKRTEENGAFELSDTQFKNHVQGEVSAPLPICPSEQEAKNHANLFFSGIAWFTPIIDRPAFYKLIQRQYQRGLQLDPNETVIFQMVMSIAEFQAAVRGRKQHSGMAQTAKKRLLFALYNVKRLMQDIELTALQALALICIAMRNLQRPGPAWLFCDQVLTRAIEQGLHRSLSAWKQHDESQEDRSHHEQMRQRIFWTIMVIHVNISGNLGRPMRLRYEDIDIEIPECTPDALAGEDPTLCTWNPAPYGFRLTQIMLEVYSTVCAVRPPMASSEKNAYTLDSQLIEFETSLPRMYTTMTDRTPLAIGAYIAGLYLKLGIYATRLIVYHPRHLRSHEIENSPHQLDVLMRTSKNILITAEDLQKMQSLDTTIYYTMDFVYAAFVSLFVTSQRARRLDMDVDVESTRKDMARWLKVFNTVGDMLGTGTALRSRISRISDKVLQGIKTELESREPASMSPGTRANGHPDAELAMRHATMQHQFYPPSAVMPGTQLRADSAHDIHQPPGYEPNVGEPLYQHPPEHYGTIPTTAGIQAPQDGYYGARPWQHHMQELNAGDYAPYEPQMGPDPHINDISPTLQYDWPNLYQQ